MDEYISFEQIPFGSESFADNPEPRCPCVLLLDTSGSMSGKPITQLNEGIQTLKKELLADPLASKRVEIAVITFGPVTVESDFSTVANFFPRPLQAEGDTPMGTAISLGIEMVTRRKNEYKAHGIGYYKPWIILITDGAPTDIHHQSCHAGEGRRSDECLRVLCHRRGRRQLRCAPRDCRPATTETERADVPRILHLALRLAQIREQQESWQ